MRGVFEFVDGDCDLSIVAKSAAAAPGDDEIEALLRKVREEPGGEDDSANGGRRRGQPLPRPCRGPPTAALQPAAAKAEPAKSDKPATSEVAQQTIRVDLERVDRLMNLVGELVINQAMLSQRLMEAGLARSRRFRPDSTSSSN